MGIEFFIVMSLSMFAWSKLGSFLFKKEWKAEVFYECFFFGVAGTAIAKLFFSAVV